MTTAAVWQLIFYPDQPGWCPAQPDVLPMALDALGVIGACCNQTAEQRYLIGPRFLQYLTFMGCAPAVQFEPQADVPFIHWHLSPCLAQPRWVIDMQQAQPKCGHCRSRMANWREQLAFQPDSLEAAQLVCSNCQSSNHLPELDWRNGAGYARQFISVLNIYPKEALPTDALLQGLQQQTGIRWKYFYCQCAPIE